MAELLLEYEIKSKLLKSEFNTGDLTREKLCAALKKKEKPEELLDPIGFDEDGDGFGAYDEKLTGHSDQDPNDKPTQEEVDAALQALEP